MGMMNQIPSEGKYCVDCPCKDVAWKSCALYEKKMSFDRYAPLRLPICISERPQIVKDAKKGINCRFAGKERDKILLVDDTIKMIYPLFIREPFRTNKGGEVFRMAAVDYFIDSHHVDEFETPAEYRLNDGTERSG